MNDQITKIRQKCIEANPEIAGTHLFEPGSFRCKYCKVERHVHDRKVHSEIVDEKTGGSSREVSETVYDMTGGPCPEHQSRPIRLADVLLAIETVSVGGTLLIDTSGQWYGMNTQLKLAEEGYLHRKLNWDLRNDDLEAQSPETVEFLAKVLNV